jgi:hypothetical protein
LRSESSSTGWSRRLGTTAQDRRCLAIGPVCQHTLQQVQVCTGRQRVEETLACRGGPLSYARLLEDLPGASHRPWKINQYPAKRRAGAKDFGQQRSRTAANVDHSSH